MWWGSQQQAGPFRDRTREGSRQEPIWPSHFSRFSADFSWRYIWKIVASTNSKVISVWFGLICQSSYHIIVTDFREFSWSLTTGYSANDLTSKQRTLNLYFKGIKTNTFIELLYLCLQEHKCTLSRTLKESSTQRQDTNQLSIFLV